MRSMTAYSSATKGKKEESVKIILRSLNYKYLDIFVHNLPAENMFLEEKIKKEIKKKVSRGRVEVYVFIKKTNGNLMIHEHNFTRYLTGIGKIAKKYKLANDLKMSDFLNLPQVISWEQSTEAKEDYVIGALKEALKQFVAFKEEEGVVIKKQIVQNIKKIKNNIQTIEKTIPKIKNGLENTKEDIAEEISLMSFYVDKLTKKIEEKQSESKGKALDFLTQEILRELNAASSKTKNKVIAASIVDSKAYLEQIREQAQNIE